MSLLLSAQQNAFYTTNGYLELEELLSEKLSLQPEFLQPGFLQPGRDQWRQNPFLKELLLSRKMAGIALSLTGKTTLRLACDYWFAPETSFEKPVKLKELFGIQGLICAFLLSPTSVQKPAKISPLGLFPFPQKEGNALIVSPDLLLNWPATSNEGLYVVAYSLSNAVYVENKRDPAALFLKQFGYGYGDLLRNETHPLIVK